VCAGGLVGFVAEVDVLDVAGDEHVDAGFCHQVHIGAVR
jgi:hypothetical protein